MIFKNDYADFGIEGVDPEKKNSKGEVFVKCPSCGPKRKPQNRNAKPLGVNVDKGTWWCNHCGFTGGLSPGNADSSPIGFKVTKLDPLTDKMIEYWAGRGISDKTLFKCEVRSKLAYIKNKKTGNVAKVPCVAFVFRLQGVLTMVKYRDGLKNFGIEKGSKLIPWLIDNVKDKKECIIVEGEPDALSFVEAGYNSVVSVPAGTTISPSEKANFEKTGEMIVENHLSLSYFDSCYKNFEDKEVIYIGTDNDAAGIKLRMEIGRRFGYNKCKIIDFGLYKYTDENGQERPCKDANEVLVHHGPKALLELLPLAKSFEIPDIVTLDQVWDEIMYQYKHGLEKGLSTMLPNLDPHFTWRPGHPLLINGYPNQGKTSWALFLMLLASIQYNIVWGVYSPENYPEPDVFTLLLEMYIGNTMDKEIHDRATIDEVIKAKEFINNHFILASNINGYSPEDIIKVFNQMILSKGIQGFIIDPWNSLVHKKAYNESLDDYLTLHLSSFVRFITYNKLFGVVSTHPPTPKGDERKHPDIPSAFQIHGGAIWYNKFYEMMSVHREGEFFIVDIQKVKKQKLTGTPTNGDYVRFKYIGRTNRFITDKGYDPFTKTKKDLFEDQGQFINM